MCNENKPCKNGETCVNSKCVPKVDKAKLKASIATKKSIISNNEIVTK